MKQGNLFGSELNEENESEYTGKIKAPIYKPSNKQPHPMELVDYSKSLRLISEIENSNITEEEKKFLIHASRRHNVFNYEKIADYYAHANPEMQRLMEKSALVIIDFDKAIQFGYVQLTKEISKLYLEDYGK